MDSTIEEVLKKGIEAHKAGQVQEADKYYTAILQSHPNHPDANHNMGVLAVGIGKVQESLHFFQKAIKSNESIAQFWISYIDALIRLNQDEEALNFFLQAKGKGFNQDTLNQIELRLKKLQTPEKLEISGDPPEDQLQLFIKLYNQGEYKKLELLIKKNLQKFTRSAQLYKMLGMVNYALKQNDSAINNYKKALEINPRDSYLLNNIGVACKKQKEYEKAINYYKKAIDLNPKFADAYNNVSNVFIEFGDYKKAIRYAKRAIQVNPDFAQAYNNLGRIYLNLDQLYKATQNCNKAIDLKNNFAEAHNNLGLINLKLKKYKKANKHFETAVTINPSLVEAINNLGLSFEQRNDYQTAIKYFNKAIEINPEFSEAYNNKGLIFKKYGEIRKAIKFFNLSLKIKRSQPQVYINVGNSLNEIGKEIFAKKSLNKALEINPKFTAAFWNLVGTAKNIDTAQKYTQKCLKSDSSHIKSKVINAALEAYKGDDNNLIELNSTNFKNHPILRSVNWFFSLPYKPKLYFSRWDFFSNIIKDSELSRPFYEFGVWKGVAFKYLIKHFKRGFGFDTFTGLPENWHGEKAGTYSNKGNIPDIKGGEFIVGDFKDTLPKFFSSIRPVASLINFDADLYSSTKCALNYSDSIIDKKTILIFDEFIINENWEEDEYKALNEFCSERNYVYRVIGVSFFTKQVAVQIKNK